MKVALVINPKAGTIQTKERLILSFKELANKLMAQGAFQVFTTKYAGHATEIARETVASGFDICIAAGGDGTMNEVACGLVGSKTVLGIVPLGSGNGLARHLKISLDPLTAFRQMIQGESSQMDVGLVNGSMFFLAAGVGFEGVVAHRFAKKKSRGFFQYLLSSAQTFLGYSNLEVSGVADGVRFSSRVFTLTIANGSEYGNGAQIAPGAKIDDGLLQLIQILPFPFWKSPDIFRRLMTGKLEGCPYFCELPFRRLYLQSDQNLLGHLDGEPVSYGNQIEVKLLPDRLWVRQP